MGSQGRQDTKLSLLQPTPSAYRASRGWQCICATDSGTSEVDPELCSNGCCTEYLMVTDHCSLPFKGSTGPGQSTVLFRACIRSGHLLFVASAFGFHSPSFTKQHSESLLGTCSLTLSFKEPYPRPQRLVSQHIQYPWPQRLNHKGHILQINAIKVIPRTCTGRELFLLVLNLQDYGLHLWQQFCHHEVRTSPRMELT